MIMEKENGTLRVFRQHYGIMATITWILLYWKREIRIFKVNRLKIYYKGE